MNPRGGTEIQFDELEKRLPKKFWNFITITTSVPEKTPIDKTKLNILWLKNSYDQPNVAPWFSKKDNHIKYDWYVFNSHWSYEKYRLYFNVPTDRCIVIKNALPDIKWTERTSYKADKVLKLIYVSTPWRGLNVLLSAMHHLVNEEIQLDVYSSTQIYGDAFKKANDDEYKPLYDHAREMSNVNYKGYASHEKIIEEMQQSHVFAYPSIWEETSCNSAIEAMASGNVALVTNFGALPETCGDYGFYVNYNTDPELLAREYAEHVKFIKRVLPDEVLQLQLSNQRQHYIHFYSWNRRIQEWISFLKNALDKKGIKHDE